MSKLPSMPLFVDAYLGDTKRLTLEEHGAYLLLLMAMWIRGGSVPDDDTDNARILGVGIKKWKRLKLRLLPFLEVYGPDGNRVISQKRLVSERNRVIEYLNLQSAKGKRSAEYRQQRKQGDSSNRGSPPVATAVDVRLQPGGQPELNRASTAKTKKDIITSLQDAEAPEEGEAEGREASAAPDGASASLGMNGHTHELAKPKRKFDLPGTRQSSPEELMAALDRKLNPLRH